MAIIRRERTEYRLTYTDNIQIKIPDCIWLSDAIVRSGRRDTPIYAEFRDGTQWLNCVPSAIERAMDEVKQARKLVAAA